MTDPTTEQLEEAKAIFEQSGLDAAGIALIYLNRELNRRRGSATNTGRPREAGTPEELAQRQRWREAKARRGTMRG